MPDYLKRTILNGRSVLLILATSVLISLFIFSIYRVDSPFAASSEVLAVPIIDSQQEERLPINHDITYVIYFDKADLATSEVSRKVLDQFVTIYSEFLEHDLSAEVGDHFDSVLAGFTFKLPTSEDTRKKLAAMHSGALHSGDLMTLLYQYLTQHAEMQLISSLVELHLEKDQTVST